MKSNLIIPAALLFSFTSALANVLTKGKENLPQKSKEQATQEILFTENKGQFANQNYIPRTDVLFGGSAQQLAFHITKNGISYQLYRVDRYKEVEDLKTKEMLNEIDQQTIFRTDIKWLNANLNPVIKTDEAVSGYANYYLEQCPNGALNVKSYKGITLQNIYNNIDLHYYQKEGQLKYDYIVAPHADYKQIQLEVKGASIKLQQDGSLLIETPLGKIQEQAPVVFQNGIQLKSHYTLKNNCIGFEVENYNNNYTLIIDPITRLWATYYGGSGDDLCKFTTVDAAGNAYMAGHTGSNSGTLIATTGSHQNIFGGNAFDAFLAKFNGSGLRLWSTYYGGTGSDFAISTNIDATGDLYMTGYTSSNTGTVMATSGSHQGAYGGGSYDAYLVKFNNSGVRLWATYYGGAGTDVGNGCTTDASGNVYMAGYTDGATGTAIATSGSHQGAYAGGTWDAFLVKFNSNGVRLWGTYYGGTANDAAYSCATDISGNIYMSGYTGSTGVAIATSGSHQSNNNGGDDGFLVKFNSAGARQWATFYGGSANDPVYSCATDASGNIFIAGHTASTTGTLISSTGAYQSTFGGGWDAFLAKFNNSGVRLWGTYCGGSGNDYCYSCVPDGAGNVYIAGYTNSNTGTSIASVGSYQNSNAGGNDAFLVKYFGTGVRAWGTYYGGTGEDYGSSSSIDAAGNVYLIGSTDSAGGTAIATTGSHQDSFGGFHDNFLVKFADCSNMVPVASVNSITCSGSTISFSSSISITTSATYTWAGPNSFTSSVQNPTIAGASALHIGVYTVNISNGICSETATVQIDAVNPSPTITVNSGSICSGEKFIITPAGANTYTITGGNFTVSPSTTTSYSVTGKSLEGCFSSKVVSTVTVNTCTGLKEIDGTNLYVLKIYPNPSYGNLNLSIHLNQDSKLEVELFDCIGRKIQDVLHEANYPSGEFVISQQVLEITEGLYFVRITINGQQNSLKWIIEN